MNKKDGGTATYESKVFPYFTINKWGAINRTPHRISIKAFLWRADNLGSIALVAQRCGGIVGSDLQVHEVPHDRVPSCARSLRRLAVFSGDTGGPHEAL